MLTEIHSALSLDRVINITLAQNDPIQILNETLSMWFGSSISCINFNGNNALNILLPLIETTPFHYLNCKCCTFARLTVATKTDVVPPGKYFPLYALGDVPNGTIFSATNTAGTLGNTCDQTYNISTPTQAQLQKKYKYTPEDLRNSTRIIWSLAQYDPTSSVSPNQPGINAPAMSADRNVSRILYTSNMGHREDLWAPDPTDRDSVIRTRKIELESIKGWLGWYDL